MAPKMKRRKKTNGFAGFDTSSAFGPSCGKRKGNNAKVKDKISKEACNCRTSHNFQIDSQSQLLQGHQFHGHIQNRKSTKTLHSNYFPVSCRNLIMPLLKPKVVVPINRADKNFLNFIILAVQEFGHKTML